MELDKFALHIPAASRVGDQWRVEQGAINMRVEPANWQPFQLFTGGLALCKTLLGSSNSRME